MCVGVSVCRGSVKEWKNNSDMVFSSAFPKNDRVLMEDAESVSPRGNLNHFNRRRERLLRLLWTR